MIKVFVTNGRADQHGIPNFISELKDDFNWVGISGKSKEDAKNELYRMIDTSYVKTMSGLLYGALTDNFQTYYDYIGDLDKDGYDHMIVLLKKLVRYKCFALYSMETLRRIMMLIENLVTDHRNALEGIPGLYEVCESVLKQIRGSDTSEINIWLSNEVLEFLQRELIWLYNNERLLHITFYTFASLIRDHNNDPRLESLKAKEIKLCRTIFDAHYTSFFKIGRDLLRLLRDNLVISEFLYVISAIPDDVKAGLMKQRTLSYCLSSRLSIDMNDRLTHMLEQHSTYKRKFDFFKANFLSAEPRYLIADIIRWIVGAYRSNNEKVMNNRYILINLLLQENNWEAIELAKIALVYDWLCFDRNSKDPNVIRDGLYCIEPCIQLIVESVKSNNLRIAKDIVETLHSSISLFPGFDNELRENVRAASQVAIARNIMTVEDIKIIRAKLSEFVGDTRILKIIGDLWGHLMNAPPISSTMPYLSNPTQPMVMQQTPSAANVPVPSMSYQDTNQRVPTSLPISSHDKPPEVVDLTGSRPETNFQTNFQNLDNQLLSTKRRDSIQHGPPILDQPSNASVAQVTKSQETKSTVEETMTSSNVLTSSTRIIAPPSSNSVTVPASLWLYQKLLKSFKVASLASSSVEETQHLRQILDLFINSVNLDAPNSPHLTDLPAFIGPDICRSLNFDELNQCFNLSSECLEINPSKQNLFNCLVSWVFSHKDEPSKNDSPKFKSFEMYRLVKKDEKSNSEKATLKLLVYCFRSLKLDKLGAVLTKDFKSLINLYIEYINYEVKREDAQSNVEEEVKKRFLTGVQLLQQYECNVFDSIVPKLLQNWPDIFVGNFDFITSIIHGINPMLIYKFETDLRLGHYKVFGDIVDWDDVLANSLSCWGSFEQLYLFQLIKAEIGNDIEKVEEFICSSEQLKFLEPIEHPEALCGLLSLLELIPPTENNVSLLTKLITNAKSQESKFENIKFIVSIFTRWNDIFPDRLIKVMTDEVENKIRKVEENETLLKKHLATNNNNNNESDDDEKEASAFFDVIVELWKNEKLKQAFMSIRPNFMLLGASVGKETKETAAAFSTSEAAEDDGEMEVEEDDDTIYDQPTTTVSTRSKRKAKLVETEDRSKRSTGSHNNRNAQNQPKTEVATSEESSSSHEKTNEKTRGKKMIKPKRVKRKINPTSSESDEEQTANSNKNHRQTKKRPTTSDRRKSVSSGGEEEIKTGRNVRSKAKNASASTRSDLSKVSSSSQQNINRRKSVSGSNSKKRNPKGSDEE